MIVLVLADGLQDEQACYLVCGESGYKRYLYRASQEV